MNLIYSKEIINALYPKIGEELEERKTKNTWVFPDIRASFPKITHNGDDVIEPFLYYVTSGEALRKTEILMSDIREKLEEHADNVSMLTSLSDLLLDISDFYSILIEAKGPSMYLEITKCEDGLYGGNICARKDPKKKKVQT